MARTTCLLWAKLVWDSIEGILVKWMFVCLLPSNESVATLNLSNDLDDNEHNDAYTNSTQLRLKLLSDPLFYA